MYKYIIPIVLIVSIMIVERQIMLNKNCIDSSDSCGDSNLVLPLLIFICSFIIFKYIYSLPSSLSVVSSTIITKMISSYITNVSKRNPYVGNKLAKIIVSPLTFSLNLLPTFISDPIRSILLIGCSMYYK